MFFMPHGDFLHEWTILPLSKNDKVNTVIVFSSFLQIWETTYHSIGKKNLSLYFANLRNHDDFFYTFSLKIYKRNPKDFQLKHFFYDWEGLPMHTKLHIKT